MTYVVKLTHTYTIWGRIEDREGQRTLEFEDVIPLGDGTDELWVHLTSDELKRLLFRWSETHLRALSYKEEELVLISQKTHTHEHMNLLGGTAISATTQGKHLGSRMNYHINYKDIIQLAEQWEDLWGFVPERLR